MIHLPTGRSCEIYIDRTGFARLVRYVPNDPEWKSVSRQHRVEPDEAKREAKLDTDFYIGVMFPGNKSRSLVRSSYLQP